MKALVFHQQPRRAPEGAEVLPALGHLVLEDLPEPDLPARDWAMVRSRIAGICGSDLGFLSGKAFPSAEPYFALPFVPGHELLGVVEAVGPDVQGVAPGDRVVVDPTLACRERGYEAPCAACREGHPSRCERYTDGRFGPGFLIGTCGDVGGGWSERYPAAAHNLYRVPDEIGDAEASLIEPFSICLHAVLRSPPPAKGHALVIGAGTIGLLTAAAVRAVAPDCRVTVVAKYPFQAELARAVGAGTTVDAAAPEAMEHLGEVLESDVYSLYGGGALLRTGADVTYETVASGATLNQALRSTRAGGHVVLLGCAGVPEAVDWTPIWMKELHLSGSFLYGTEPLHGHATPSFAAALSLIASRAADLRPLAPKLFSIEEHDQALVQAASKASSGAAKVSFAFAG